MTRVTRMLACVCAGFLAPRSAFAQEAGGLASTNSFSASSTAAVESSPLVSPSAAPSMVQPAGAGTAPAMGIADPGVPAEQASVAAGEVVVTASRFPLPVREVPDSISVVEPDGIRDNNARDLGQAVGRAPGVLVAPYGGAGSGANISLRGSRANQVLVLEDGRPLNQVSSGEADASQVAAGMAERVEILSGPSSLLYGSSAVGGVVNVMTPEPPSSFSGAVEGQGGTFGTITRRASVGGPVMGTRWLLLHDGTRSDGCRPNSEYQGESFLLKGELPGRPRVVVAGGTSDTSVGVPGVRPSVLPYDAMDIDPVSWSANPARRSPADEEFGNGEASSLIDRQGDSERWVDTRVEADAGEGGVLGLHHFQSYGSLDHRYGSYYGFGNPEIRDSGIDTDVQGAGAQYTVRRWLAGRGRLTVGGEWRKERLVARERTLDTVTGSAKDKENIRARVETGAEYAEGSVKPLGPLLEMVSRPELDILTVAGGARLDRHSVTGSVLNPHAGAALDASRFAPVLDVLVFRGSWGTVFRSPSLNDLFWPSSPFSAGNPLLRPERGHIAEGSVECGKAGVTARVGAFTREIRDQIDWAPDSAGKWQPRNTGLVKTRGVEGGLSVRRGWARAEGTVTAVDARQTGSEVIEYDAVTWAPVATETRERFASHVASWTAGASAGVDAPTGTGLSVTLKGAGPRKMYIEDTFGIFPRARTLTKRLGSYAVVGARVTQAVTKSLELNAGVENLADRRYSSRFGNTIGDRDYPAPPRTFYAGATARW